MTLRDFTVARKEELIAFFKARFGPRWRRIVARQADMHPASFHRWKAAPPVSLYRQIDKLERWARSIGFQSAMDEDLRAAIGEHQRFREAAAEEVDKALGKRNNRSSGDEDTKSRQLRAAISEAMKNAGAQSRPN